VSNFLETILPETGTYCVVGIKSGKTKQRFYQTLEEISVAATALDSDGTDAYFALATFKNGSARTAANAALLRSFFIDLDCGENKPYPDQPAAATALSQFVTITGLPTPYVVYSGGGLHAYWPFEESIPVEVWLPAARDFKAMCVSHKLGIDLSVTADAARILRVPGTHHYKTGVPKPVHIAVNGAVTPFAELMKKIPTQVDLSAAAFGTDALTRDLAGSDYPKSKFARIVKKSFAGAGCNQIRLAVEQAATLEEPLWRAALSVAWNCVDGETAIHKLSQNHPQYEANDTVEKAERLTGKPYTCEWYRLNNPKGCEGCQQKCNSPISIGRIVEAAEPQGDVYIVEAPLNADTAEHNVTVEVEIPVYPFPYFRGKKGGVYRKGEDKDGNPTEVEVYPQDLYITSRFYDSAEQGDGDGEVVALNLHLPHDGIRRFHAPVTALLAKDSLRDVLVKHGVIAYGKDLDNIMGYLASSIRKLQHGMAASKTRSQMGWTPEGSFVVGEIEYTNAGPKLAPPASSTKELAPLLHSKGSLDEWKDIISFYGKPGMEGHALGFLAGAGAPLLQLLNSTQVKGVVLNLVSNESGTGKTTVQMAVNSLFGHPVELLMGKRDTAASMYHRLGTLNNIALTIDEMTNAKPEEISNLIYNASSGRGAHRMHSMTNQMRTNHTKWCTVMLTSSNAVMADALASFNTAADGELRRVIDLHIEVPQGIPKAESDSHFSRLADNYGVAGPIFAEHIVANREVVAAKLKQVQARVDRDMEMQRNDRFYSALVTIAFTAGLYLKELGLLDWDLSRIYKFAMAQVASLKADVDASVGSADVMARETLAQFINDNVNNTLIISAGLDGLPAAPVQHPRGSLRMRYEPDTKELLIVASDLKKYFTERRVDFKDSLSRLHKCGLLKQHKPGEYTTVRRIAAGALGGMAAPATRCYIFNGAELMTGTGDSHGSHDEPA
jgi:hypothetical protein